MFESVATYLLNKYLGKYIQDLDSEKLNIGIFSGTVQLTDLQLKTEALYELDLPIEVKVGCIGKISIDIPWMTLYSDPVLVHIEDVLILVGPIADRNYDAEKDKRLMRAYKKKKLDNVQNATIDPGLADKSRGFFENLIATIVNNIQISIQNVHVRYEDCLAGIHSAVAAGFALQSFTAITTNSKWKPTQVDGDAKNIFKLIKFESFSVYWNPVCKYENLIISYIASGPNNNWKQVMKKGLATFSIGKEDFEFIVKPVSAKAKMIFHKSEDENVPKLLVDFVLQDVAVQFSKQQYISVLKMQKTLESLTVNTRYRKYRPDVPARGHTKEWWLYGYNSVMEEWIRPYSWKRIKQHRDLYRRYKKLYKERLQHPADTELRLDLQKVEDSLDITTVLIAREESKLQLVEENPEKIQRKIKGSSWWLSWFFNENNDLEEEIEVIGENEKTLWSRLVSEEKESLQEAIGYVGNTPTIETSEQYIAHKINFTLANCTILLLNAEKEILILTLTQFLSSIETRPMAKAFKISARTESFIIEGASIENDLVPVVTADNITSGSNVSHVFAFDFEKNPLYVNADYGLTVSGEPVEIVYQEHSISQLLAFIDVSTNNLAHLRELLIQKLHNIEELSRHLLAYVLEQRKTIHLVVDLKSPYFVIPEFGSVQKGGSLLIVDMGRLTIKSDLQLETPAIEDATKMELEEKLYDRFCIVLADIQVLFADSGDAWRVAKQMMESEIHLMPKVRIQIIYSNSVNPSYRLSPRQKLNVSVPSLKLSLSDRRLRLLMEFIQNLPLPDANHAITSDVVDGGVSGKPEMEVFLDSRETQLESTLQELQHIRHQICSSSLIAKIKVSRSSSDASVPGSIQYFSTSDHSDEEPEGWARMIDLPGFDDNVSPSNSINILLRFLVGEVVIHLSRSSDHVDKPYLMLRIDKICTDTALMDFGLAVQASLGGVQLIDKLHTGSSGEYLDLITSTGKQDMVTILYRKVQSNCPEFKSHFHQVEHSLVLDLTSLSIMFHREAFMTLGRFLLYVSEKLKPLSEDRLYKTLFSDVHLDPTNIIFSTENDPPIPHGATKFSISVHVNAINMKLCDTEYNLAEVTVSGLECDYILKANDKMILRVNLTNLGVEDLVESTLYPKLLSIEDDKVFDMKYVKHSRRQKEVGSEEETPTLPKDGSFRLRIGRMQVVLLQRFISELHRFFEPFVHPHITTTLIKSAEKAVQHQMEEMKKQSLKLQVAVDIHAPTIIIPQKTSSPNLLVVSLGDLNIENFFKEVVSLERPRKNYVDNILVRLSSLQMSRSIILLDGTMESQEAIVEPMKLRLDIKRALAPYEKSILLYDIRGTLDFIKVNIGQRDISTMIAIYEENFAEAVPMLKPGSSPTSPLEPPCVTPTVHDESVKKLEAFLNATGTVHKETSVSFTLEGLQVMLYTDAEEVWSSPVRDPACSLSKFELDEINMSLDINNDTSCEFKLSLQSATLEDVRQDSVLAVKKIFQTYSGDSHLSGSGFTGISLSMPPVIDMTYHQNNVGDAAVDIIIEKTRLNMSVPYIFSILKFFHDCLPADHHRETKSLEGFLTAERQKGQEGTRPGHRRLPSDNTSGYHSTISASEELKSFSVAAYLKKPEVVFFADPTDANSQVLVMKTDILFDYSHSMGQNNISMSVDSLHILSCAYNMRKATMYTVLSPCSMEFVKSHRISEDEVKINITLSSIEVRLSTSIIHSVINITNELMSDIKSQMAPPETKVTKKQPEIFDLWSPKQITPIRWLLSSSEICTKRSYFINAPEEVMNFHLPELKVTYEIYENNRSIPQLYFKLALNAEVHNWSRELYLKSNVQLEMLYYNEKLGNWEPLFEPVMENENHYRPWEFSIKAFRGESQPILCRHDAREDILLADALDGDAVSSSSHILSDSTSSTDSDDNNDMTVIRRNRPRKSVTCQKSHDSCSLVTYPGDSDSETEESVFEKIASAFGHLFSESSDDNDESDDNEETADADPKSDLEEQKENVSCSDDYPVFLNSDKRGIDEVDSVQDEKMSMGMFVFINSKDQLEINVTPTSLKVIQDVRDIFTGSGMPEVSLLSPKDRKVLALKNELGPKSEVHVLKKEEHTEKYFIDIDAEGMADHDDEKPRQHHLLVDVSPTETESDFGDEADGFSVSSAVLQAGRMTTEALHFVEESVEDLYSKTTKERLSIEVEGFEKFQCLMPRKSGSTMYALHSLQNKSRYYFLVEIDILHGQKTVTVHSPLQLENHLSRAVHVLCQKASLLAVDSAVNSYIKNPFHEDYVQLATLEAGEVYNVPLLVAYHCPLYFQAASSPSDTLGYEVTQEALWWQDIETLQKHAKFLYSRSLNKTTGLCMKLVCLEKKHIKSPAVGTKLVPNYTVHIYPPVVVHNCLPYTLELLWQKTDTRITLQEGENVELYNVEPNKTLEILLEIQHYLSCHWRGKLELSTVVVEQKSIQMEAESKPKVANRYLAINIFLSQQYSLDVYLFSPYWVLNKSGLPLQIRGSSTDNVYESCPNIQEPLLFRFKKHKRKKAKVRVYNSRWSHSFSLDTIGNKGVVVCVDKERKKKYRLFATIQLSRLKLTKIVTLLPYYIIVNKTKHDLRFMEENETADLWMDIAPEHSLPYWPETDSQKMYVKHRDSSIISQHFPIKISHTTVLRMENGSALCVDVSGGTDTPVTISFLPHTAGDSPVRVENLCEDLFLKIQQKSLNQVTLLSPYQSVLYTWDDPTVEHTLIWNLYNRKKMGFPALISKDGFGEEKLTFHTLRHGLLTQHKSKSILGDSSTDDDDSEMEDGPLLPKKTRKDKVVVYWVSFLDGKQRVLLFTQDERIASQARKEMGAENSYLDLFLSLSGVGLSLMNNAYQEVAYLGLQAAPATWEVELNSAWRLLNLELSSWLEDKWRAGQHKADLKDGFVQVDFKKMHMTKPFYGSLRRAYSPAIWCQMRKSTHQMFTHLKLHRLQLDNQLPDAIFPTVLHPVPMPQQIIRKAGPKPFIEMELVTHQAQDLSLDSVKYFKLLVQELNVQIDKGFLMSTYDIFSEFFSEEAEKEQIKEDLLVINLVLQDFSQDAFSARSQRKVFEFFHLSPLKIHFSFSAQGSVHKSKPDPWSLQQDLIDFFTSSVGATLTEVKDVEIKMAFFEKKGTVMTIEQLLRDAQSHYTNQAIQQAYVLILGLDVLGNPYGLVQDFTKGFGDFFYEPFLGSMYGPEEFAESLSRGAQSLMGHVIGGTAGSVSVITRSVGQALALFSFDDEYKKKRRQRMQQAASLPETLTIAAKGFVQGIVLGVSGVFVKPVTGAQHEGIEGFFKGIGKGILGLLTKPAGSVVDMVSMAFDGIRRAAEMGEHVIVRLRLPRFINPTLGLKPYSPYQATGYRLLLTLSKGHYSTSDIYWAHTALSKDDRADITLITNRHIFLLERNRIWGDCDIQWVVRVDDIMTVPVILNKRIVIKIREDDSLMSLAGSERYIASDDHQLLEWLKLKIEKVLMANMEDKPCPQCV